MQESNAFSPVPTTLPDFECTHLGADQALAERTSNPRNVEVPDVVAQYEIARSACHCTMLRNLFIAML